MLKLLKVSGSSLEPEYQDGDFVLVSKIPYLFGPVRPGETIAFRHAVHGTMIKKVQRVTPERDQVHVVGTHDYSVDSRRFGAVQTHDVIGKVIWHLKKAKA